MSRDGIPSGPASEVGVRGVVISRVSRIWPIVVVVLVAVLDVAVPRSEGAIKQPITTGPVVDLSLPGQSPGDPELAVDPAGAYLLAWTNQGTVGPISAISSSVVRSPSVLDVRKYGSSSDFGPLGVAVASDGTRAVDYYVYGEPTPTTVFGKKVTLVEANRRVETHTLVRPSNELDPDGGGGPVFDSRGRLLDSWVRYRGSDSSLTLARQTSDSTFVARPLFDDHSGGGIWIQQVALDSGNRPVIAWTRGSTGAGAFLARDRKRAGSLQVPEIAMVMASNHQGRLDVAQRLRRGCAVESLAVASSGEAAAAMVCNKGSNGFQIYVSERAPGDPFGEPVLASGRGGDEFAPSLTIARNGRVWLTWLHRKNFNPDTGSEEVRAQVSTARFGQRLGAPTWVTPFENQDSPPALLTGPMSHLYLVRQSDSGTLTIRPLLKYGQLGPTTSISPAGIQGPQIAVDSSGEGIAAWNLPVANGNEIQARTFTLPG